MPSSFLIPPELGGKSLDLALVALCPNLSRRRLRAAIEQGRVRIDGQKITYAAHKVALGDELTIDMRGLTEEKKAPKVQLSQYDILWQGQNLIALNKPPGIEVQKRGSWDLVRAVGELIKAPKVFPCHRLDKETSGVILVATTSQAQLWITEQFEKQALAKTYLALCLGKPKESSWQARCWLARPQGEERKVRITEKGKGSLAITDFRLLGYAAKHRLSLIQCEPQTGRMHQIRVQLAKAGIPVLGDKVYADDKEVPQTIARWTFAHHLLHAQTLTFTPAANASPVTVRAEVPANFEAILRKTALY